MSGAVQRPSSTVGTCGKSSVEGPHLNEVGQGEMLGKTDVHDQFNRVACVQDASFQTGCGEVFCIVGLSGSGRSTLICYGNRLIEPASGQLFKEGHDVDALLRKDIRQLCAKRTCMVFQNMALMPHRTVLEI